MEKTPSTIQIMLLDSVKEVEVNTLIREYLHYADYVSTAKEFENECAIKGRIPAVKNSDSGRDLDPNESKMDDVKNRFLLFFKDGDRQGFFRLWDEVFPHAVRQRDALYQRLEFQLSIYFAVFPIHPNVNARAAQKHKLSRTMEAFKNFLETRGADLCKTTQFLSFYALPYVPDPRSHPSFSEIFTERHINELEERLGTFLMAALRTAKVPRLMKIVSGVDMRPAEDAQMQATEITYLRKQLRELEVIERETSHKYRGLQTDYHNLITIASELVQTLAACINGEMITASYLSSICQRLSAFKKSTSTRKAHDGPVKVSSAGSIDRSLAEMENDGYGNGQQRRVPADGNNGTRPRSRTRSTFGVADVNADVENLDFDTIRNELLPTDDEMQIRKQARILEALRIRLCTSHNPKIRRQVLKLYTTHNIFNISTPQPLISSILKSGSPILVEQLARLLNVMSSESVGRGYLLNGNGGSLEGVVEEFVTGAVDTAAHRNLLGALQKLSLRRSAQSLMNRLGVVDYLLTLLDKTDSLSEYEIEYGVALLMNLCLRTEGRRQCAQEVEKTMSILAVLLENESLQVKTYVNGALYSLLSEPVFRERAKEIGLEAILLSQKSLTDERLVNQVNYVIEKLGSDEVPDSDTLSEDGEDHEEEEEDEDEEEEYDQDENDSHTFSDPQEDELTGLDLLKTYSRKKSRSRSSRNQSSESPLGGLVGSQHESLHKDTLPAVRRSMPAGFASGDLPLGVREIKRSKTPVSRPITPKLTESQMKKAGGGVQRNYMEALEPFNKSSVERIQDSLEKGSSASVGKPVKSAGRRREKVTVPANLDDDKLDDLRLGFSTRPKISRTPINGSYDELPTE
ncbi:LisH domain-containing protein armc9 [Chytridiales sp. JEL 0842]|nr:LisH domain-containing protein armc9 [Chytridiales sp. JEL 0842]